MFENRVLEFIDNYKLMMKTDNYISKKEYDSFLNNYNDIFNIILSQQSNISELSKEKVVFIMNDGYNVLSERNKKYLDKKLIQYKEYFDNIFKGIDDNILLDDEQRKAIISNEDYTLVVAGAGSGKTTTMAAKVKFLVDIKKISPEKIIVLAFTIKARNELIKRINKDFNIPASVLTFHSLGMSFIRNLNSKPVKIASERKQKEIIINYFKDVLFTNKDLLEQYMNYFKDFIKFDSYVYKYKNFNEYFKNYVDRKYNYYKDNLKEYNFIKINNRLKSNHTINGEFVKSKGEALVANYLYKNGYDYGYECLYPDFAFEHKSYCPDFTVYDDDDNLYIEYFGLSKYDVNGNFSKKEIDEYNEIIQKKKELHKKYNTKLIELYSEDLICNKYENILNVQLDKYNITHLKKEEKEIFYRLEYTNQESQFFLFINLISSFITKFKDKTYDSSSFEKILSKIENIELKTQLKLVIPIYNYYENYLRENNLIDFSDMINYAYKGMQKFKEKNKYIDYEYLIIDEYQDISLSRYNLATRLSSLFNAKIVAVGDDWQSIFGFSGSDVDLFTHFYELMGYADIIKITKTYRNSQELLDVAGEFVQKNNNQIEKKLSSDKHINKPIRILYYDKYTKDSKVLLLEKIINYIYNKNNNSKILLLGRYKDDITEFLLSNKFVMGSGSKLTYLNNTNIKLDFLTIHSSKGLGYDEVILLNSLNDNLRGFPSKIVDNPLLSILDSYSKDSEIDYPEERRLFYVAITRTKNKVYILTPNNIADRSDFVMEISTNENVSAM